MGLDLTFMAGEDRFDVRLSHVDWEVISLLGKSCPGAVQTITRVDDFGEPRTEERAELLAAIDTVLNELEKEGETIPFVYRHTIMEGPGAGVSGSGRTGGIRINGDGYFYSLHGGLGQCFLEKRGLSPDGRSLVVLERRDMRGTTELKTDNCGTIVISRTKKRTRLRSALEELKAFLSRTTATGITKVLGCPLASRSARRSRSWEPSGHELRRPSFGWEG